MLLHNYNKLNQNKMNTNFKLNQNELKLALQDSTSSTLWTGYDYDKWFSKTFFESVAGKNFTKLLGVKSKTKVGKMDATIGTMVQDDDGTFSSSNLVISQKAIEVAPKKINIELPIQILEQGFGSNYLANGSDNVATTGDFLNYALDFVSRLASHELEILTWSSSDTEGLVYKATNDTGTTKVTAIASSAITSSTIIAEMTKIYNAIPNTIIGAADTRIYLSSSMYYAYRLAFAANALSSGVFNGDVSAVNFCGVMVEEAKGLASGKAVVVQDSNAVYSTDIEADSKNLQVIDLWTAQGKPSLLIATRFKFAVDYVVSSQVVLYA